MTAIIIPLALQWSGLMDIRLLGPGDGGPTPRPSAEGTMLATDSPVKVRWTGVGDTIDVSWEQMEYRALNHYSLDVYGLAPTETWYNVGYRSGEELRTSDVTNPISITNEKFSDDGSAQRVTRDETWRVCVTGMRKTPGGVDITPYIIRGSKKCSDPFNVL